MLTGPDSPPQLSDWYMQLEGGGRGHLASFFQTGIDFGNDIMQVAFLMGFSRLLTFVIVMLFCISGPSLLSCGSRNKLCKL